SGKYESRALSLLRLRHVAHHLSAQNEPRKHTIETGNTTKMKIDDLTIGEARQIAELFSRQAGALIMSENPYQIGKNYFIRTVTHHLTGRLIKVTQSELVLEDAAWIPDDGRFSDALRTGKVNEVEPFGTGEVIVGRGAVI